MLKRVFIFSDLLDIFDVKITAELYSKAKPDPECFLLAAKKLKIAPNQCIVFEDALNGVKAAITAHMDYFVIQGIVPLEEFKKLDKKAKIIKDFTQVEII